MCSCEDPHVFLTVPTLTYYFACAIAFFLEIFLVPW